MITRFIRILKKRADERNRDSQPENLNSIVRKFISRWVLLCLAGLLLVAAAWGGYQLHFIRKNQQYNARAVSDHVDSYLRACNRDLQYAATFFMRPLGEISTLKKFLRTNGNFQEVYVLGSLGDTLRSVPVEAGVANFSGMIRSTPVEADFYLTSPYYSSFEKELVVSMIRPISRDRMILAELDLEALQASVSELTRHMRSGFAILTDEKGNVIAHPDMSQADNRLNTRMLQLVSAPSKGRAQSSFYWTSDGYDLLSVTKAGSSNWKIFVGQNVIKLFWPLLVIMGLSLALLLFLLGTGSFFFRRRLLHHVVTPLTQFTRNVTAMKQGQRADWSFSKKPRGLKGIAELRTLWKEFREMREAISRREKALRENERKLQTLMNNLPGMAYRCYNTPDWNMDFVSEGCYDLLGYSVEDLLSRGALKYGDLIHPDDAPWVWEQVQKAVQNDRPFQVEYRIGTVQDEEKWVWEQGQAVDTASDGTEVIEGFITDITERRTFQERLNYLSFHDALTGLYNRNFFEEEMRRLQSGREGQIGIIVCDLNGLKLINDTLGHERGDEMLVNAAGLIRGNFRAGDVVARIGGDEFAVLLTDMEEEKVQELVQRIREAVRKHNDRDPRIHLTLSIGYAVSSGEVADPQALFREADNRMYREKIQQGQSAHSSIVQALMRALEARDFITEGHSDRLQNLVTSLAHGLHLAHETRNDLCLFAQFHDLGKVGIPDRILFKEGPLNEEEAREMRKHPEIGHRIAKSVPQLEHLADWILKHHEWWDGRGYPLGLEGRDIPLPCRILAIADAYDAMTSDRPYRSALSHQEAVRELRANAGVQFDPELVELFLETSVSEVEVLEEGGFF